jgi:alkyl hydroperoxide reductase subunit AhpC
MGRQVDELVEAIDQLQREHKHRTALLRQVAESVIDTAPDGMTVVYLPADTLAAIRAVTN